MKIGILAGNNKNLYASAMIQMLIKSGYSIRLAVLNNPSVYASVVRKLKIASFKKLILKSFFRNTGKKEGSNLFLKEYMYRNKFSPDNIKKLSICNNFDVIFSDDVNNSTTVSYLQKSNIDILIYTSGGILKKSLIQTPRIGVLNAHMGLLPKYRGMNVLEWALFYGDPIGVTIHFIDEGIDTGAILIRRKMVVEKGDTIEKLRQKSIVLNLKLMKEAIDLINEGKFKKIPNPRNNGKQYFVMHDSIKKLVELKLMKG